MNETNLKQMRVMKTLFIIAILKLLMFTTFSVTAQPVNITQGIAKFFNGAIDDVSIYNRPLADSEIKIVYASDTTLTLTSPPNDTIYIAPADIVISATATDGNNKIETVEFYNESQLMLTDDEAPYSVQWVNVPVGNYLITAKAKDKDKKVINMSNTVNVIVADKKLTVKPTYPVNNSRDTIPADIPLNADGTTEQVDHRNKVSRPLQWKHFNFQRNHSSIRRQRMPGIRTR
jgi:hypothetical protein